MHSNQSINADVVIIGGGPIGLAHAWGIKKLNPSLKVVVFEKYGTYQRSHNLIIEPEKFHTLLKATNALDDAELSQLLTQLKENPHVRTNSLENIFKEAAKKAGVQTIIKEITSNDLHSTLKNIKPLRLLIGADGTHSIVNQTLFPKGNQLKYHLDYTLQFRYEIIGDKKPQAISELLQEIVNLGFISNESVGHPENRRTSVTLQIVIPESIFNNLKNSATSKKPIKPFINTDYSTNPLLLENIPESIRHFLNHYLISRLKACQENHTTIDPASIRISVNEAPATRAKQVTCLNPLPVVLCGDASLGLSYFKGLNSGFESCTKLLKLLTPALQNNLSTPFNSVLNEYETWFGKEFSPKKITEVKEYSTWRIKILGFLIKVISGIKNLFYTDHVFPQDTLLKAFFNSREKPLSNNQHTQPFKLYPHRIADPSRLGQFVTTPTYYYTAKIKKLFIDIFKPYKNSFQKNQDLKQHFLGLVNLISGLEKLLDGIFYQKSYRIKESFISIFLGALQIILLPITWCVKIPLRHVITYFTGSPDIEDGIQINILAQNARIMIDNSNLSSIQIYELLAICHDIHRKYDKAIKKGQPHRDPASEKLFFAEINKNIYEDKFSKEPILKYLSLFSSNKPIQNSPSISKVGLAPINA